MAPWDQQPDESDRDFERFLGWLGQPAGTTLAEYASAIGVSAGTIYRIARTHRWRARSLALRRSMADRREAVQTAAWAEIQRRQAEAWDLALEAATAALERAATSPDAPISFRDAVAALAKISEAQRLAAGQATSRPEVAIDLGALSDEELDQLADLVERASGKEKPAS